MQVTNLGRLDEVHFQVTNSSLFFFVDFISGRMYCLVAYLCTVHMT